MTRALLARDRWGRGARFPELALRWEGFTVDTRGDPAAIVYPHLFGFRLAMAMLTQPSWPLPPWRTMQVRNRLILHRAAQPVLSGALTSSVGGWRVLDKGVEVDLHARLTDRDGCAWESIVTCYSRGRFGEGESRGAELGAPRVSPQVAADAGTERRWITDGTRRWRYASWTGDYNGLHQWDWYARRLGFEGASAHPQRIAILCLHHVGHPVGGAQQLDLWLKWPVRYGAAVVLRERAHADGKAVDFSLMAEADSRPAMVGCWRAR